jgi:diketogulonate reductase-like aldo/keto reductase
MTPRTYLPPKKCLVYSGSSSTLVESTIIKEIADKHHATPAQVILSWGVQRGTIVIPKSENEQRLLDNLTVSLSEQDLRVACLTDWAIYHV